MSGPFTFPVAQAVPFDGSDALPPFVAENAKEGIIEARNSAPGKARAPITLQHNGTLGNNNWHGYSSSIPSNTTPIILPWDCTLTEYTFSNQNTSVDGNMEFYLNGTSAGDIIYTINFNNVNQTLTDLPDLDFVAGDLLRLRWDDNGQNPSDVASVLFFLLT